MIRCPECEYQIRTCIYSGYEGASYVDVYECQACGCRFVKTYVYSHTRVIEHGCQVHSDEESN